MRLTAPAEAAGERLDAFLAQPLGSRTRAARLIAAGAVLVDGRPVQKRLSLLGGEQIDIAEEEDPKLAERERDDTPPAQFGVAYEDDWLIVVDKPAGVVVHPARGHAQGTLAQAVGGHLVHRLDRDTSGLLIVARDEEIHRELKALLQERGITREYLALVEGRPPARNGTIDAPIGRDRRVRTRHSTDTDSPRSAVTHFELAEALPHTTLLRVRLETGRTHQIRVHLQAIGHPVVGDPEYGHAGQLGLERQFLHAARLAFTHPATGEPIDVTSALPDDLRAALDLAAHPR